MYVPVMRVGDGEGCGAVPSAVSSTVIGGNGSDFARLWIDLSMTSAVAPTLTDQFVKLA